MSEDDTAADDWFERALEGDDADDGTDPSAESGDADGSVADDGTDGTDPSGATDATDAADASGVTETTETADASGVTDTTDAGEFSASDGSPRSSTGTEAAEPFGGLDPGQDPTPGTDAGTDPGTTGADARAFDPESATFGDGDSMFDEDFEQAMGAVGGGDDFGDEDLETNIPRIDIGIEGLDNMIQGGVPERHLAVVIGSPGTGKTTFGLQFLRHGLARDDTDRGVFITLEQSYDSIMATAAEHDWEFERHERAGDLAIVDLDPVEMANSLDNIRSELPALIEGFDADRFVLDSVSLLEMMYDDQARRRTEVFDFTQSLKQAGVTTVLTSEADEDNPYASRHGIIEYLTDAVFLLRYVRSETQETRLAVEIQKIRNANHSRETKPYDITLDGISVYEQANIF